VDNVNVTPIVPTPPGTQAISPFASALNTNGTQLPSAELLQAGGVSPQTGATPGQPSSLPAVTTPLASPTPQVGNAALPITGGSAVIGANPSGNVVQFSNSNNFNYGGNLNAAASTGIFNTTGSLPAATGQPSVVRPLAGTLLGAVNNADVINNMIQGTLEPSAPQNAAPLQTVATINTLNVDPAQVLGTTGQSGLNAAFYGAITGIGSNTNTTLPSAPNGLTINSLDNSTTGVGQTNSLVSNSLRQATAFNAKPLNVVASFQTAETSVAQEALDQLQTPRASATVNLPQGLNPVKNQPAHTPQTLVGVDGNSGRGPVLSQALLAKLAETVPSTAGDRARAVDGMDRRRGISAVEADTAARLGLANSQYVGESNASSSSHRSRENMSGGFTGGNSQQQSNHSSGGDSSSGRQPKQDSLLGDVMGGPRQHSVDWHSLDDLLTAV
jgi:hypothetical protein